MHNEETMTEDELTERVSATGRLFELMSRAVQVNGNLPIVSAWATISGGSEQDHGRGFDLLAHAYRLIEEAKQEVLRRSEIKQELFMRSINSVEQLLKSTNYANPWHTVSTPLQQALNALEFSAERMNAFSSERAIPRADVDELLQQVRLVRQSLNEAEIDVELKRQLLRQLDEIDVALTNYNLRGADGVVTAMNASVGFVVRMKDKISEVTSVKEVNDFLDLVIKLETIVTRAVAYTTIGLPAIQALLSSGQSVAQ